MRKPRKLTRTGIKDIDVEVPKSESVMFSPDEYTRLFVEGDNGKVLIDDERETMVNLMFNGWTMTEAARYVGLEVSTFTPELKRPEELETEEVIQESD